MSHNNPSEELQRNALPHIERPLVSYIILTYMQENVVEQAVRSALAQTYNPLEIIISDDCSTDGTWQKILDVVKGYDGSHKIILNRNERNLGVAAHSAKIRKFVHGKISIGAAGDDYSDPTRAEKIAKVFAENENVTMVSSGFCKVDSQSKIIAQSKPTFSGDVIELDSAPVRIFPKLPCFVGAVLAYAVSSLRKFQPIKKKCWAEDIIYSFRACLAGRVFYIDEPLVYYRATGGISSTRSSSLEMTLRVNAGRRACYEQILEDVCSLEDFKDRKPLQSMIECKLRLSSLFERALSATGFWERIKMAIVYALKSDDAFKRKMGVLFLSLMPNELRGKVFKRIYR